MEIFSFHFSPFINNLFLLLLIVLLDFNILSSSLFVLFLKAQRIVNNQKTHRDLEMLLIILTICMLLFPTEPSPHFVLVPLMLQLTEAHQPRASCPRPAEQWCPYSGLYSYLQLLFFSNKQTSPETSSSQEEVVRWQVQGQSTCQLTGHAPPHQTMFSPWDLLQQLRTALTTVSIHPVVLLFPL